MPKSSMGVPVVVELHTRVSKGNVWFVCATEPLCIRAPVCCSLRAHRRAGQELSKAPIVSRQAHSYWFAVAGPYITEAI